MRLSECSLCEKREVVGFCCGVDQDRMLALGFFIGSKIGVVAKKKSMMVVCVSNTYYAVNKKMASMVVVK